MPTKKNIFETYIQPCVLYASETIVWKTELLKKMKVFQHNMMRWMSGKRLIDKTPIPKLFELTHRKYNQEKETEMVWSCKKKRPACTNYYRRTYRRQTLSSWQTETEMEKRHYRVDEDHELVDRQ